MSNNNFITRPLVPIAILGLSGTLLSNKFSFCPLLVCLSLGMISAILAIVYRNTKYSTLLLLSTSFITYLALSLLAKNSSPNNISNFIPRRDITVQGFLVSPIKSHNFFSTWQGVIKCQKAIWKNKNYIVSGKIKFIAKGKTPNWKPGAYIELQGTLTNIPTPLNPGEFNLKQLMAKRKIVGQLKVARKSKASCLKPAALFSLGAIGQTLNNQLQQTILKTIPPKAQPWVIALLTGDRSHLTKL